MRTFSFTETREDQCEALVCFQQSRRLFGRVDLIRCAIIALVVLIALFGYNNFGTGASYESNGVSRPLIARALVLFVLLLPSWLLGMLGWCGGAGSWSGRRGALEQASRVCGDRSPLVLTASGSRLIGQAGSVVLGGSGWIESTVLVTGGG